MLLRRRLGAAVILGLGQWLIFRLTDFNRNFINEDSKISND